MAFLELLSGATRAWVVTTNLSAGANDLLDGSLLSATPCHLGLLQFALLLALKLVFDFVDGSGDTARGPTVSAALRASCVRNSSLGGTRGWR